MEVTQEAEYAIAEWYGSGEGEAWDAILSDGLEPDRVLPVQLGSPERR
jgi:hypothetical protein